MAAYRYLSDHFTATRVLVCGPVIFLVSFHFDRVALSLPPGDQSAATIKRARRRKRQREKKKRNSKIDCWDVVPWRDINLSLLSFSLPLYLSPLRPLHASRDGFDDQTLSTSEW